MSSGMLFSALKTNQILSFHSISLFNKVSKASLIFRVEVISKNDVENEVKKVGEDNLLEWKSLSIQILLAKHDNPYLRLHLFEPSTKESIDPFAQSSEFAFKSASPNKDNLLTLTEVKIRSKETSSEEVKYLVHTMKSKKSKESYCLALNSNGDITTVEFESVLQKLESLSQNNSEPCYLFDCNILPELPSSISPESAPSAPSLTKRPSHLQKWQLRRFLTEGYLHLSNNLIPSFHLNAIKHYLMYELGQVNHLVPGGIQGASFVKFMGNISHHDILQNIWKDADVILESNKLSTTYYSENDLSQLKTNPSSQLKEIVEEILDIRLHDDLFPLNTQIAFRFPEIRNTNLIENPELLEWHTDGYRQGFSRPFSLLVGVCLCDIDDEYAGNLAVWPSSHLLIHQSILPESKGNLNIPQILENISQNPYFEDLRISDERKEILRTKIEIEDGAALYENPDNRGNHLPILGKPLQMKMKAGDVVILHPDLAHNGAPNYSFNIRQMLYYRIKFWKGDRKEPDQFSLKTVFEDYKGIQRRLGEEMTEIQNKLLPS